MSRCIQQGHRALSYQAWDMRLQEARNRMDGAQWHRDAYRGAAVGTRLNFPVRALLGTGALDFAQQTHPSGVENGIVNYAVALLCAAVETAGGGVAGTAAGLAGCLVGAPKGCAQAGFRLGKEITAWPLHGVSVGVADALGCVSLVTQCFASALGAGFGVALGACRNNKALDTRLDWLIESSNGVYVRALEEMRTLRSREESLRELTALRHELVRLRGDVVHLEMKSRRVHARSPLHFYARAERAIEDVLLAAPWAKCAESPALSGMAAPVELQ